MATAWLHGYALGFVFTDVITALGNLRVLFVMVTAMAAAYLVIGAVSDLRRIVRRRRMAKLTADLATVLFSDEEVAADAAEKLVGIPASVLLPVLQNLTADLDGEADERLRNIVAVTGTTRAIVRRLRSRRWRRRVQAASLCPLLPAGDPRRTVLLDDRHPIVRSRAAEHLEREDIAHAAPRLLALLDDPSDAVRFAAQHALLQGDGRIVEPLGEYLREADGAGVVWALEVAGTLRDPRLGTAVGRHLVSDRVDRRAMAARSLLPMGDGVERIRGLLDDTDAEVRAAALAAVAGPGGEALAAPVGRLLSDRSWKVRQEAGRSLATMGPTGALVLRSHLADTDPYARDMAQRVLDDVEAKGGRAVTPAPIPRGLDPWGSDDADDRTEGRAA
ncbi:MAG: HEAT repeat domain-containing protein [Acidimicrobiales bacterium]